MPHEDDGATAQSILRMKVRGRVRYVLIDENPISYHPPTEWPERQKSTMPPKMPEPANPREAAIQKVLQQLSLGLQAAIEMNLPTVAIAVGKAIDEAKWELEILAADGALNSGRPFSPETLATRWSCSAAHIRNLIKAGKLDGFWLGGQLLRIPAVEVRRFEKEGPKIAPSKGHLSGDGPAA
jgi:hypothetical protein